MQPDGLIAGVDENLHPPGQHLVFYRLDRNLTIVSASVSDSFLDLHQTLFDQRRIDHPWSRFEEERYAQLARDLSKAMPTEWPAVQ